MSKVNENPTVEHEFTENYGMKLLVLSEEIKPGHVFWDEMIRQGYDPLPVSFHDTSIGYDDIQALLINDTADTITPEIVDWISHQSEGIGNCPRILLGNSNDYLIDFKKTLYECQFVLEVDVDNPVSLENSASKLSQIADKLSVNISDPPDWQSFAMHMLDKTRDSHKQKGLIENVGSLAPLINEYEFAIKSALKLVAEAFEVPLASILMIDEKSVYTLVNGQVSRKNLALQISHLKDHFGQKDGDSQVSEIVWGRRFVKPDTIDTEHYTEFIGEPVQVKEHVLGYWSIPQIDKTKYDSYLMSVLTKQIFMLLYSSLLYKAQKRSNQNHFLRLGAINEVCRLFTNLDTKNFGLQFLLILLEHISADSGVFALMDNNGKIAELYEAGIDEETQQLMRTGEISIPWSEVLQSNGPKSGYISEPKLCREESILGMHYIGYPLSDVQGKIGAIFIFFKNPPGDGADSLPFIQTMATLASTHLSNLDLYKQFLEKRLMEEQINIARDIQRNLLPKETPVLRDLIIAATSRPAKQVGGDFYDLIELPDNKWVVLIGDVSGKGIPASMLMSMTKSLLKFRFLKTSDLQSVIGEVNTYLAYETPPEKFVTTQAIWIDQIKKRICFANAGHGPLLIYRAARDTFDEIDVDGLAMGILPDFEYAIAETSFETGDIILMFTDGLSEAMSPTREQFGYERIKHIVREKAYTQPSIMLEELYNANVRHANGTPQHDDTTVIVIKAK